MVKVRIYMRKEGATLINSRLKLVVVAATTLIVNKALITAWMVVMVVLTDKTFICGNAATITKINIGKRSVQTQISSNCEKEMRLILQ